MDGDDLLVAQIITGNHSAYEQMYARYCQVLRRYLWCLFGNGDCLVEDALQETFTKLWQKASTLEDGAKVAPWLFRVAYREALQLQTKRIQRNEVPVESISESHCSTPDALESQVIDRIELQSAFASIPIEMRAVALLIFYQGFSVEQVAGILEIPVGTVKSRIRRAAIALRQSLTLVADRAVAREEHRDGK